MRGRWFIGACAVTLAVVAIVFAVQGLIAGIRLSLATHSLVSATGGVFTAVPLGLCVYVLARLAYRNLFWSRYVASVRREADTAIAPSNDRTVR